MSTIDADTLTPQAIRTAREAVGWSIAEAVRELRALSPDPLPSAPSLVRAWKRWEHGTVPSRIYRPLLVRLLGLDGTGSLVTDVLPDLSGLWYASWQSWHDQQEVLGVQQVRMRQRGEHLSWEAIDRGSPTDGGDAFTVEDGGYLWRGELRLWDNKLLLGWYAADDGSVLSKGAVHLVLHPHGQRLTGRWTGLSYDGDHETGLGAMARTEADVKTLVDDLLARER
jgi:hypothetical protein